MVKGDDVRGDCANLVARVAAVVVVAVVVVAVGARADLSTKVGGELR